jgi:putative membrane protein
MQRKTLFIGLTLGLALAMTPNGFAKMTSADVLNDLHEANLTEIHMGHLAEQKGASDQARDYGKMLASDHSDNDQKVKELATKAGITLKAEKPNMMHDMKMKSLKDETGADFDRKFAKGMIDDHKKDIEKLQKAQKEPLSQDVKDLIAETLPKLQKHLETAQKIYGQPS